MESIFAVQTTPDQEDEGVSTAYDGQPPSIRLSGNKFSKDHIQNDIENEILLLDDIEEF